MSPEEFERIKQAEKAHLRKLKELKEAARTLERAKRMNRAVGEITDGRQHLLDEHTEMVDRLALETAQSEARLEMALDATREAEQQAKLEEAERELQQLRAQELVRRMKADLDPPAPATSRAPRPDQEAPDQEAPDPLAETGNAALPEKTIGRMRR